MSQKNGQDGWQPNIKQDNIFLIRLVVFGIHAASAPFKLAWIRPGYIGRRSFDMSYFVGLAFIYPLFGQWPHDSIDFRIFMRSWQALWILCIAQAMAAKLFNRRLGVHSREMGWRPWVGRSGNPFWPLVLVSIPAHFLLEPVCQGLGTYFTFGPMAYVVGHALVNWKMNREIEEYEDAQIAGSDLNYRLNRR